jgi:hypothetical protein
MNEQPTAIAGAPSPQALAGLAVSAAILETLLRRGILDQTAADVVLKDAGSYISALSTDFGPEIERDARVLLAQLGKVEKAVETDEAQPST